MEVGESLLCATESQRDSVRRTLYDLGRKCVSRKVEGGWRVWRKA